MNSCSRAEPIPISALEHASYCPRQCALIHLESVWDENVFTLRGTALHARPDAPTTRQEGGHRVERGLPLWSDVLGLVGKADVVEFHGEVPYPVEYKSGAAREGRHESASAVCLAHEANASRATEGIPGSTSRVR